MDNKIRIYKACVRPVMTYARWGRQRRREWYNLVKRMTENRLPRIALEGTPTGNRPPGRPPKR